ncbi:MAG: LiaI-LiaF-like domain-containing protein [Acidimicrobiia bacterium]
MNRARLLFGAVLVALGAVLFGDALDWWVSDEVISKWWPVVLILTAIAGATANPRHLMGPAILGAVGVAFLIDRLDVIDISFEVFWPLVVVAVGLMMLLGRPRPQIVEGDRLSAFAAFGGTEVASHSKHFESGNVGAVFGGAEVDLRDATLAEGATLDVFTAFGGTEVRVPEGWKVITHGLPLFGGFENITTKESLPEDAPVLDISATVLFGGLEVKH